MLGDIDKDVAHPFLSSFSDDTRVGKSVQNEQDVQILQEDLYKIYAVSYTHLTLPTILLV